MEDCIFCKILKGDIPSAKVYEDEKVYAFLDINPCNAGHTLVIPKTHYHTLFDIPEEELFACMGVAKRLGEAVFKAVGADGMNVLQNNYRASGQIVDHVHIHLMPRFMRDGVWQSWESRQYGEGEMDEVKKKIVEAL